MMKKLLFVFLLTISSATFGQSKLAPCLGPYSDKWTMCKGGYTFANGNKYVGEYKDGKRNGHGTFTFASGDKYVGEYKDGKPNGQGTYTFANGNKYIGAFKNDDFNGQGTFTYADGDKYVGEFKYDKFNGLGTYTFANGKKSVGIWKDGERIEQLSEYALLERLERVQQEQSIPLRVKARKDVVAQALNYVDGGGENIDGRIVWLPTHRSNGDCIFKQIGGYGESIIDLNKGNPNAIEFLTHGDSYVSKVDGLPALYCKLDTNCIGTRVRRAWVVIYKECKGTRKAF